MKALVDHACCACMCVHMRMCIALVCACALCAAFRQSHSDPQMAAPLRFGRSALANCLLELWGYGRLSATGVQRLAEAAVMDGMRDEALVLLASTGTFGSHPGNINRDLRRVYLRDLQLPALYDVPVAYISLKEDNPFLESKASCLLPHEVLHKLSHFYPMEYERMFGIASCQEFWGQCREDDPRFYQSPVMERADWMSCFVPLWVHGDGVQFQTNDSLLTIDWGGVLGVGSTIDTAIYTAAWPASVRAQTKRGHPANTWDPIWDVLCWSFTCCFTGTHPPVDHRGEPWPHGSEQERLAGTSLTPQGHRFAIWNLVGDRDFFTKEFGLPSHSSNNFCWNCKADRTTPGLEWTDFRPGTGWEETLVSAADALAEPASGHPVFSIPGVCLHSVRYDMLHVTDNHGVSNHFIGNVLFELCFRPGPRRPHQTLGVIWQRIQELYSAYGSRSRLTSLQLSMFCNPSRPHREYPMLKTKAAETRHLIGIIYQVCLELDAQSEHDQHRLLAAQHLHEFYLVVDRNGILLPPSESSQLFESVRRFLVHYSWLASESVSLGLVRYNVAPKFHDLWHLAYMAKWQNPRTHWTYKSEDFVGVVATMGMSCQHGTAAHNLSHSLGDKYRALLHMRLLTGGFQDE